MRGAVNGFESAYVRPVSYYGGGSLHLDVDPLDVSRGRRNAVDPASRSQSVRLRAPHPKKPARSILRSIDRWIRELHTAKRHATQNGFDEALFVDDELRLDNRKMYLPSLMGLLLLYLIQTRYQALLETPSLN